MKLRSTDQIKDSVLQNTICFCSEKYETEMSRETSQGSSTFEYRLDELHAIDLLWKLTSLSISSSSSSSSPSSYSSKTSWLRMVQATFSGSAGFCPTRVSNPGTERLLVPIEAPVLADPSRRSRVDKYSFKKKVNERDPSINPHQLNSSTDWWETERSHVKALTVGPRVPFDAFLKEPFNILLQAWTRR